MNELVNHPNHYRGEDNPYEAIKVIEAGDLNFNLGNKNNPYVAFNSAQDCDKSTP